MINNTDINRQPDFSTEGNVPLNEANGGTKNKLSVNKLKSCGKKSLSPLIELVHRYQDEITPYFEAISKGLQGGVDSLSRINTGEGQSNAQKVSDNSEVEKVVAGWFNEAAEGLNGFRSRLSSSNAQEIFDYIEAQAKKHPGFMFSSSYLAGLFFGRIGRHIGRKSYQQSGTGSTLTH